MYTPEQMDEDIMCEEISDRIEMIKTTDSFMKNEQVELNNFLVLEDSYSFKGSLNCNMIICTATDGTIQVFSQYGERMGIFTSITGLAKFLQSLMNGEFA